MRALCRPAEASYSLVYTFRPASFRIGLVVSGLGLAALGLLALWAVAPATGFPWKRSHPARILWPTSWELPVK